MNNKREEQLYYIDASIINKKFRTKEDRINFARESCISSINLFRVLFSITSWIRWEVLPSMDTR